MRFRRPSFRKQKQSTEPLISSSQPTSPQLEQQTPASSVTPSSQDEIQFHLDEENQLSQLPPAISDLIPIQEQNFTSLIPTNPILSANNVITTKRKMRILVLSSDTGGGHRASAQALREALQQLYPTELQIDIADFWVDLAEGPFTNFPQQYTYLAKHPWMWKLTYELTRFPPGRAFTEAFFNSFAHSKVRSAFIKYAPDLIVSVHPLVNTLSQNVLESLSELTGLPKVPYVTVVTDLGGAHPTWFHKKSDVTYIPSVGVRRVAERIGIPNTKLQQLGLPVRSDFWIPSPPKSQIRAQLGIRETGISVLCVGGGDGVGGLKGIVEQLAKTLSTEIGYEQIQVIVVCGKNEKLRLQLSQKDWPIPIIALGYVANMSDWMSAADIICTKAGPGTIAESLIRELPIIITGFLPGQEEMNVKYVLDERVGEYAKTPIEIANKVVEWVSQPTLLKEMSERAKLCGKPNASLEIAENIIQVAKRRIVENIIKMEEIRTSRPLHIEGENRVGYPLLSRSQSLNESARQSHLVFRLKFLLRVVMGSVIAREALSHNLNSRDISLTSSPVQSEDSDVTI